MALVHPFLRLSIPLQDKKVLEFQSQCFQLFFFQFLPSTDALSVAVQPAGEAAAAEMVHTNNRAREEEGDPGHDDVGVGPSATLLQLHPMEGPQDCLQEVLTRDTVALDLWYNSKICFSFTADTGLSVEQSRPLTLLQLMLNLIPLSKYPLITDTPRINNELTRP